MKRTIAVTLQSACVLVFAGCASSRTADSPEPLARETTLAWADAGGDEAAIIRFFPPEPYGPARTWEWPELTPMSEVIEKTNGFGWPCKVKLSKAQNGETHGRLPGAYCLTFETGHNLCEIRVVLASHRQLLCHSGMFYVPVYHHLCTGTEILRVNLLSGDSRIIELPLVCRAHSIYWNKVRMRIEGDSLIVFGDELAGRYIAAIDLKKFALEEFCMVRD